MIKLENITKRFGNYIAVNDLSLEIGASELFGFLGPNGAGKTTTIKMITGILQPTEGTIEVDGLDIQKQPEAAKSIIGYIPDDPFLYGRLSGREYIDFVGGLYRLDKKTLRQKAAELFDTFEMNGWVDKKCEEYSHGMRQKLVFCSAFLHDPKVLVVDEPVVGLDPQSTKQLKEMLKNYARAGATVFVSTHILSIAEELCDRVGIINKGKLIDVGSISELKTRAARSDANLESLFLEFISSGRDS